MTDPTAWTCPVCFRVIVRTPHHCDRSTLYASRPTELTAAVGTLDTIDTDARNLSGLVLPFGEVGDTSIGPIPVAADCQLEMPADVSRIKLVDEHSKPPRSIGYATATRRTPGGYRASFHIGATALGDAAVLEASEGLRDGFSVEMDRLEFNARGELVAARLNRVALVVTPAYPSARHDGLAASQSTTNQEEDHPMTEEQRARLAELLALPADQLTDDTIRERNELLGAATADDLAAVTALVVKNAGGEEKPAEKPEEEKPAEPQSVAAAHVPSGLGNGARRGTRTKPIRELYAAQARVMSGVSRPNLEAALTDITMTSNIWTMPDAYAGELWSGLQYQRQWVQNSTSDTLSAMKGVGWRWLVKPTVADYAGDKAAVPSNAPTTEATEWNAARIAGAHDLDRAHFDFGNTEFIEGYYRALREDYAVKSDAKALAFQLASKTALAVAETSLFRAVAVASQAVEDNTLGAPIDFIYVNSADRLNLLDVTGTDIPAYLEMFGITPDKFKAAPGVAAGTVVVGTRQATKFRELTETPIRVEAINVANGGIDGGVFGYYATELVFPGGIVSKTFA